MRHNAWLTSSNARFIGVLERDEFAFDPRKDPYLAPELVQSMGEQYDDGDVWRYAVYPIAFKPNLQVAFGPDFPIENLIGDPVDSLNGIYGYDYARNLILECLEECENAEE